MTVWKRDSAGKQISVVWDKSTRQMAVLLNQIASQTSEFYMSGIYQHLVPELCRFPAVLNMTVPIKSLLGVDQTMIKCIKVVLYNSAARFVDRLVVIEPNHCHCRDIRPSSGRSVEPVWEFYVKLNHRGCPPSKVSTKPDI